MDNILLKDLIAVYQEDKQEELILPYLNTILNPKKFDKEQALIFQQDLRKIMGSDGFIELKYQPYYLKETLSLLNERAKSTSKSILEKSFPRIHLIHNSIEKSQLVSKHTVLIQFLREITNKHLKHLFILDLSRSYKEKISRYQGIYNSLGIEVQYIAIMEDKYFIDNILIFEKEIAKLENTDLTFLSDFILETLAMHSIAHVSKKREFQFPTFEEKSFSLKGFYHPLIKNPIKNDLILNETTKVVLLTGPNMSGKSTFFKALQLCTHLAHIGFPVPASNFSLHFRNELHAHLNNHDSLIEGYSQFMNEVYSLKETLVTLKAGSSMISIFDELFKGTNIDDAQAILLLTINKLSENISNRSVIFISTHLLHLEDQIAGESIEKYFLDCEITEGKPLFTYQLRKGWSKLKIGEILFQNEGLPDLLEL
jgi:DNA mismatch repair protein MutS